MAWANDAGSAAPLFDLQSLPGATAFEDAGLVINEFQGPSSTPREVGQSLQMKRARNRRARHRHGMLPPLVVTGPYLFVGVQACHLILRAAPERGTAHRAMMTSRAVLRAPPVQAARIWANECGLSTPGFDPQSLLCEDALEDAGICVDEVQCLSVMPGVVWRSLEMWRARDRRARHHDDVPLALVVVGGYLFMAEPVWHVALTVMRAKRQAWRDGLSAPAQCTPGVSQVLDVVDRFAMSGRRVPAG
jgi:hypothetical protein